MSGSQSYFGRKLMGAIDSTWEVEEKGGIEDNSSVSDLSNCEVH